jgi:cell division protein FtsW
MIVSRTDRSGFADWWWTIDRIALASTLSLICIGVMLAFAASPAATGGFDTAGNFGYALKQLAFATIAVGVLFAASMLEPRQMRALCATLFALAFIGATIALFTSDEVGGARRWIDFGGLKLQPSEFLKPAFAVLAATFLSEKIKRGYRGDLILLGMLVPVVAVLLMQPDVGQTMLLVVLSVSMLFFAGLPYYWIAGMAAGSGGLAVLAYVLHPHVRERVNQFLDPSTGYQTGLAMKAFEAGGFAGVGPGAGTVKYRLPDSHTDFIYAVAGEEFGLILCGLIVALFAVVTIRLLLRSAKSRDPFVQLAGAGLALVVGLQAFINMGVNLSMLPAKGMTLPFVSYGGSSLLAVALTLGLALGITRKRPTLPESRSPESLSYEARA